MQKYIIIVDDSQTIRTTVEFAVKKLGYPIREEEDGEEVAYKDCDEMVNDDTDSDIDEVMKWMKMLL